MPTDPRARGLALVGVAAFACFLLVYALAVLTEPGQRVDEAALAGGRAVPAAAQDAADRLLRAISITSLLAATAALSALAWLRRRPELLLLPVLVVGASLALTELFKLVLLPRPALTADSILAGNTYPSGHTTVAASIGLAAVLIAPARIRLTVAFSAATVAAAAGVFVVTADWHRPSDPIGSYLITLAVAAACAAYALDHRRSPSVQAAEGPPGGGAHRVEIAAIAAAAGLLAGSILLASLRYGAEVDWNRLHAAYLLAAAAIVVFAGASVSALVRALSGARVG